MNPSSNALLPSPVQSVQAKPGSDAILSHIPMPLFVLDKDGIVVFANDACEAFLGKASQKFIGSAISEHIEFEEGRLNDALMSGSSDLTAQNMKLHHPTIADPVDISLSNFVDDGRALRIVTIFLRKAARNHLNEDGLPGSRQAIGAPAILGHEIKNPLAGIRGAAQLLARSEEKTQKAMTDLIVTEVDRIARLLDQMQNLSGTNKLQVEAQNVHIVLERAIKSIRAANADMPSISINYDPSIPEVMIDFDALVQVSINLLQNAIDALEGHSDPHIEISTRFVMSGALHDTMNTEESGKTTKLPVEITISDNGPGVPSNILSEMFSPFVSSKRDGQGIGLAIVRKLIQQMRGRIHFERDSARSRTKFCIYLPTAESGKR